MAKASYIGGIDIESIAQEVTDRAKGFSGESCAFMRGLEDAVSRLSGAIPSTSRELDVGGSIEAMRECMPHSDQSLSELGKMVGCLGGIWGEDTPEGAAKVLEDASTPIVRRILESAKSVMDEMDAAYTYAMSGMRRLQMDGIASNSRLKEQTKMILAERVTSMSSRLTVFVKGSYGSFLDSGTLDSAMHAPTMEMYSQLREAMERIDAIDVGECDETPMEQLEREYAVSRQSALDSAISEAVELVGAQMAHGIAAEVFGLRDVDGAFMRIPMKRDDAMGGMFGAAIQSIVSGGKVGSPAISTAIDLVKGMASGSGGGSGGLKGLVSSMSQSVGGLANSILGTAKTAIPAAMENVGKVASGVMDVAKDMAGSMLDCASSIGSGLIDAIGETAKGAVSMVGDMAKGLADFASDAWDAGKELASGLIDSVKGMFGTADEEVQAAVDDTAAAAQETMDSTQSEAQQLVDGETQAIESTNESMSEMENETSEKTWDEGWKDGEVNVPYQEELPPSDTQIQDTTSETTPLGNDSASESNGLVPMRDQSVTLGWRGVDPEIPQTLLGMMHDGDQQLFNPYGPDTAAWTMYSFRPSDAEKAWPQIAITPSSFEAIRSMRKMLDNVPYVVVKEYFFKNTASMMINFVKKIAGMVKQSTSNLDQEGQADMGVDDASSKEPEEVGETGSGFLDKIMNVFANIPLSRMVIDIPYVLYFCLRQKVYGNTYIFPYIVQSGNTVINEASNASEWGKDEKSLASKLKDFFASTAEALGNMALGMAGSQGHVANLFPAPSWAGPGGGGGENPAQFSFDLILINDNVIKARNNYMCVNTIIHNNRSIQKAILSFPGALYEVWLPTGQRHLMCTGDFKLYPIGLNRLTPDNFFRGGPYPGANHAIGVNLDELGLSIQNPDGPGHVENMEVIPDAYKMSVTFKSCLANNMNNAVFQYYVKMTGYDYGYNEDGGFSDSSFGPGNKSGTPLDGMVQPVAGLVDQLGQLLPDHSYGADEDSSTTSEATRASTLKSLVGMRMGEILDQGDFEEITERFDEATYNKRLGRLRTEIGEQSTTSESAVSTIRRAQSTVREVSGFLSKLYNAPDSNLWYMEDPKEQIYTTLKPDYRKMLRDRYQSRMKELREVDGEMKSVSARLSGVESQLSTQFDLEKREELLETKVHLTRGMNALTAKRDGIADDLIQIDTDIIQSAFDEHDSVVSVRKTDVGFRIFQQVWNEKIMNSYERDKLQYLTSKEKERYFKDKLRELEKFDVHGVLKRPDWFFRVVVLDRIVGEMKRLILWFKDCSWDDFETVYKITRKLRMLQLDVDAAHSGDPFDINHTNLFQVSDSDMRDYTKIDRMLVGNTLYELFSSIVRTKVVKPIEGDSGDDGSSGGKEEEDREVVRDRKSEIETERQRTVRQDIVARYWGSEAGLTKTAYDIVNKDTETRLEIPITVEIDDVEIPYQIRVETIGQLKNQIIVLKLNGSRSDKETGALQTLLGSLVNQVATIKEALVVNKMGNGSTREEEELKDKMDMSEMRELARKEIERKDGSVLADVIS